MLDAKFVTEHGRRNRELLQYYIGIIKLWLTMANMGIKISWASNVTIIFLIILLTLNIILLLMLVYLFSSNLSNSSTGGGISSDLCRSNSLGTSQSRQGRDDSSSTARVLYTGIRWLLLLHCSSVLYRDKMTPPPPLLHYCSSVLYFTILCCTMLDSIFNGNEGWV